MRWQVLVLMVNYCHGMLIGPNIAAIRARLARAVLRSEWLVNRVCH